MVDVEPIESHISNILGCFLLNETILLDINVYRSSILKVGHSDHLPIFMQLYSSVQKTTTPVKFNPRWILYDFMYLLW